MVDWATVAASGITSTLGVLVAVVLERRREMLRWVEGLEARIAEVDGRLRDNEQHLVGFRPAGEFFGEMASEALKKELRKREGR